MSIGSCSSQPQGGAITTKEWERLRAYLTLALEAVGDSPRDMTPDFIANCHMHLASALGIAKRAAADLDAAHVVDKAAPPATPVDLIEVYISSVSAHLPHAALPWAIAPLTLALQELRTKA